MSQSDADYHARSHALLARIEAQVDAWLDDDVVDIDAHRTGGLLELSLPVWIEYMGFALKGKPVDEITPPEGIVNINGEWFYEEYTAGSGVRELATDPNVPAAATEEEKKSILDLFKR